jgi:exodeoxyribonuclease VII large subunit
VSQLPLDPAGAQAGAGIPGFPGPFTVGRYAAELRDRLREFTHVAITGEVVNLRMAKTSVFFELRDADGGMPCAMWRNEYERLGVEIRDGMEVVAAGGCDFYPGGAKASPSFSFRVERLRPAGEGDLLARLQRLREQLSGEGLFEPQKRLARRALPRSIGVVTAETGAARRDLVAGLGRRGWAGRVVWGFAPVQDRRAAPAIGQAIRDLAAIGEVDVIVVTRGGGSISDLWAFCDEALCRTVALLPVPVISAVGHEVDRTLIDDVSAVCCSTPTHAAEEAVPVDCRAERVRLTGDARRISRSGRNAVLDRARALTARSRAPREHLDRHRRHLHQKAREMRASTARGLAERRGFASRVAGVVIARKVEAATARSEAARAAMARRSAGLERAAQAFAQREAVALRRQAAALRAHDPDRTLERGYALALGEDGEPLSSVEAVRAAGRFDLKLADGETKVKSDD